MCGIGGRAWRLVRGGATDMTWYAALSREDCRPVPTWDGPLSVNAHGAEVIRWWLSKGQLCSVRDAAWWIGVSESVIYNRIRRGALHYRTRGGARRVYRQEVEALRRQLREQIEAAPPVTVFIRECWPFVAGPPGPDMPFAKVLRACLPPSPFESDEWSEGDTLHLVWAARGRNRPQRKYGTVRFTRVERDGERRLVHYVAEEASA